VVLLLVGFDIANSAKRFNIRFHYGPIMEHLHYYDGLGTYEVDFDSLSIIKTEILYYGETRNAEWIQRQTLKNNSNETLNFFSKGKRSSFGGTFDRAIKKLSEQGLLRIDRRSRKDVRIWPDYKLIKLDLEERKHRNLENASLPLFRPRRNSFDHYAVGRSLSDYVPVSDSVGMSVTKAKPLK
jgi:hypothetical protein